LVVSKFDGTSEMAKLWNGNTVCSGNSCDEGGFCGPVGCGIGDAVGAMHSDASRRTVVPPVATVAVEHCAPHVHTRKLPGGIGRSATRAPRVGVEPAAVEDDIQVAHR